MYCFLGVARPELLLLLLLIEKEHVVLRFSTGEQKSEDTRQRRTRLTLRARLGVAQTRKRVVRSHWHRHSMSKSERLSYGSSVGAWLGLSKGESARAAVESAPPQEKGVRFDLGSGLTKAVEGSARLPQPRPA